MHVQLLQGMFSPLKALNLKQMLKCRWLHIQKEKLSYTNVTPSVCQRHIDGMPQLLILIGITTLPSSATARTDMYIGNVGYNTLLVFCFLFPQPKASALHCHIFLIVNDVFRWVMISVVCEHLVKCLQFLNHEFKYQ